MKVFTGDDTGLIKSINVQQNKILARFGAQNQNNSIIHLQFIDDEESLLLAVTKCSKIYLYSMNEKGFCDGFICEKQIDYSSNPIGACFSNNIVIISYENGKNYATQFNDEENFFENEYNLYSNHYVIFLREMIFDVGYENISKSILSPCKQKIVILAKKKNPLIFDIQSRKVIWKAKNVPNDFLDLRVPIYDLGATFCQKGEILYVVTAYHKLRIYDIKKGKGQPIKDYQLDYEKSALNQVILSHCGTLLYVSNKQGSIFILDTTKECKMIGKMKGCSGTIKNMNLHQTQPYLAVVGLDRFLRIYNVETKKTYLRMFLKQKLTNALFSKDLIDEENLNEDHILLLNYKHPSLKTEIKQTVQQKFSNKPKTKRMKIHEKIQINEDEVDNQEEKQVLDNYSEEEVQQDTGIFEQTVESEREEEDQNADMEIEQQQYSQEKQKNKKKKTVSKRNRKALFEDLKSDQEKTTKKNSKSKKIKK